MNIPLQAKPSLLNQLPTSPFVRTLLLNLRVTAATLESNTPVQIVFTMILTTIWHHRQTWHYFIIEFYDRVHAITFKIAGIHDIDSWTF